METLAANEVYRVGSAGVPRTLDELPMLGAMVVSRTPELGTEERLELLTRVAMRDMPELEIELGRRRIDEPGKRRWELPMLYRYVLGNLPSTRTPLERLVVITAFGATRAEDDPSVTQIARILDRPRHVIARTCNELHSRGVFVGLQP